MKKSFLNKLLTVFGVLMISIVATNSLTGQIKVISDASIIVGVDDGPVSSAKLEVNSETQGFLTPRMSNQQKELIPSPADGLLVYVAELSDDLRGFWYYDNIQGKWLKLFAGCNPE